MRYSGVRVNTMLDMRALAMYDGCMPTNTPPRAEREASRRDSVTMRFPSDLLKSLREDARQERRPLTTQVLIYIEKGRECWRKGEHVRT
jgi:hypothetical protein